MRFVPKRYRHVDSRKAVRVSTGIRIADDPAGIRAYEAVQALNAELEAYWRGLVEGRPTAPVTVQSARSYAARMGLRYMPTATLAAGPLDEIRHRLELLESRGLMDDPKAVAVVFGGASSAKIALSTLLKAYEVELKTTLSKYSRDQLRRWRNAKGRAISNLMAALGRDAYIDELTRNDALDFRDWWQDRIISEGVQIGTANKDIGHLNKMFRILNRSRRLNLEPIFAELRIEGAKSGSRNPYSLAFVQNRILADGALDGLNDEARRVVYVCAETGLRPVEVCNLSKGTIRLHCDVPHVLIKAEGRVLKTDHSERHFPLVGVALEAMKLHPEGFPAYFDRSASLSATVNKYLKHHGLRPDPKHSLYSLRHTFEDRLTAVEPPEKIQAYLMGHKYDRPKYGSAPSLVQLRGWLNRIAFKPPASV